MLFLKIIGLILGTWFGICAIIWVWFFTTQHKHDHSGDGTLGIIALPFLPFVIAWHYLREAFRRK